MRLTSLILAMTLSVLAPPAVATEQDDVQLLATAIVNEGSRDKLRKMFVGFYVDALQDDLKQHPVRLLDPDSFAAALPDQLSDPLMRGVAVYMNNQCFTDAPVGWVKRTASYVRKTPEWNDPLSPKADAKVHLSFLQIYIKCVGAYVDTVKAQFKAGTLPNAGDRATFADVLERDGMAQFPNRVTRRTVLSKLRGGR